MANAVCFTCVHPITAPNKSTNSTKFLIPKSNFPPKRNPDLNFSPFPSSRCAHLLRAQDSDSNKTTKTTKTTKINSIVCADCDGNVNYEHYERSWNRGAILCTQCEGNGVNSKDHFNGKFKAGGLCWLCRGKREILCGNCNGAGFLGGFMNAFED